GPCSEVFSLSSDRSWHSSRQCLIFTPASPPRLRSHSLQKHHCLRVPLPASAPRGCATDSPSPGLLSPPAVWSWSPPALMTRSVGGMHSAGPNFSSRVSPILAHCFPARTVLATILR